MRLEKPELIQLVEDLRTLHKEGEYWDFKKEWHHEKQDLLHDIICMANNLSGQDGFIIFGVDEQTDYGYQAVERAKKKGKIIISVCY